jgi:hypothetical protein
MSRSRSDEIEAAARQFLDAAVAWREWMKGNKGSGGQETFAGSVKIAEDRLRAALLLPPEEGGPK